MLTIVSRHVEPAFYRAAVETLISNGFQPTRTVVLAFGFDEEVSGPQVWGVPISR